MKADMSSLNSETTSTQKGGTGAAGTTLSAIGNLIKLLPTGTVFLFQFLNPVVTNSGHCNTTNKYLSAILLVVCGFSCVFSSFTDSYTGSDNQRHYGIVTTKGLWPSPASQSQSIDLSMYKLKFGDFVHAALSLFVFAVLGLLDTNTVLCFYPEFEKNQMSLLQVLPTAIGVFTGGVFMMFPNNRHGIGYPKSTDSNDTTSTKSNDSAPPPNPNDIA
ncbi:protein DMP2-like [Gastrolobium bilobum]|uniref:protein DMP2-like n=1 Tax=Gastrolobium bilobum TaxID=150636 RepID=UPI002AB07A0E|nr:protein DMP2-like [Gastrolobium bilobum]